ncbi:MAG: hypothetical protein IKN27_01590 [Selenomonadaceae bacterium]|nr:hypothetical protein [Selenomonadaceae bacterium]
MKIAVTLKTLLARQIAIENILIRHGLTDKDEIQSFKEKYYDELKPIDDLVKEDVELILKTFNSNFKWLEEE